MNDDRMEGAATKMGGKMEKGVGDMTGDSKMQSDGVIDQAKGAAQNLYGGAKDAVSSVMHQAPTSVREGAERVYGTARSNPVITLIAAGVIGYALSTLFRPSDDDMDHRSDRYRGDHKRR